MPVTMEDVRAALEPEEPDYRRAATLGPEALPHLSQLVSEADPLMASKAAYLASLIRDPRSNEVLRKAAGSDRPQVRVAAAAGARNLPDDAASDVLTYLVEDRDVGVRKTALRSVPDSATPQLRSRIDDLAERDSSPAIRALAEEIMGRLRSSPHE